MVAYVVYFAGKNFSSGWKLKCQNCLFVLLQTVKQITSLRAFLTSFLPIIKRAIIKKYKDLKRVFEKYFD